MTPARRRRRRAEPRRAGCPRVLPERIMNASRHYSPQSRRKRSSVSKAREEGRLMAKFEAKKFRSFDVEQNGISKKTMEEHYKLYQGYVSKANEILDRLGSGQVDLSKANPTYSELRELKVELTRAIGGVKNHELYFEHLGGKGGKPAGRLLEMIEKTFGSFEQWQADLRATGIAARGWAWLAYDWD